MKSNAGESTLGGKPGTRSPTAVQRKINQKPDPIDREISKTEVAAQPNNETSNGKASETESFRLLDLPPEIRNMIYEYCAHPTAFIPKKVDYGCNCDPITQTYHVGCDFSKGLIRGEGHFNPRPIQFYDEISPVRRNLLFLPQLLTGRLGMLFVDLWPKTELDAMLNLNILSINRQIRSEALPIFYRDNIFAFADVKDLLPWLIKNCGWDDIKHIRRVWGQVPLEVNPDRVERVAVVLLLMELGILKCELRLVPQTEYPTRNEHFCCKLWQGVKDHVASQAIGQNDIVPDMKALASLVAPVIGSRRRLYHSSDDPVCKVCGNNSPTGSPLLMRSPHLDGHAG